MLCVLIFVELAGLPAASAATPTPHLNGAGLVIKHGDGRILYFYVQFTEAQITGSQLLERSGVSLDETPYAGIGGAICRIDGEGCPSSNCFCKSFANPSIYWRYQRLSPSGQWVFINSGPDQSIVHDGDVDGWSWSAENGDLPATSINQIAQLNGIVRAPTQAQATEPSSSTTAATPVILATPSTRPTDALARTTATPQVLGVAVSESGQKTPIKPVATQTHESWHRYFWFGAVILGLLLVAAISLLRRRVWTSR